MDYSYGKGGGGPSTYTGTGNTPQAMQLALTQGQTLTAPQVNAAAQGVEAANANIGQLNTEAGRQPYIDNTNLGAVQNNYDALAQRLAAYDNMVLKPEFAGQNPNSPQDVALGGVTSAIPEFTSQAANYTPEQLTWSPNPKYAVSAQYQQADSILGLMQNLNELLGKERARGTAKHTSDLKAASALLAGFTDILGQDTQLKMKLADIAATNKDKVLTKNIGEFQKRAEQIKQSFLLGKFSTSDPQAAWGAAWKNLRTVADTLGLENEITNEDIDSILGGEYDAETGQGFGNAAPEALQDLYLKGRPVAQQNAVPGLGAAVTNIKSARDEYNKSWSKGNPLAALYSLPYVGQLAASYIDQPAYNYIKNVEGVLGTQVAKGIGGDVGALANRDIDRAKSELANLQDNPAAAKPRLDKAVMHATQAMMRITKEKTIVINPTTLDKVQVDTPEELEQVFNQGYTLIK